MSIRDIARRINKKKKRILVVTLKLKNLAHFDIFLVVPLYCLRAAVD